MSRGARLAVEKPKNNKTNDIKIKALNGYDAIREKPDEHNTLTKGSG